MKDMPNLGSIYLQMTGHVALKAHIVNPDQRIDCLKSGS